MESSGPSSATSKAERKNHSATTRLSCHGWWSTPDASCPGARKVHDGKTPFERLHGKRPTQEFVPFGEKVLARQVTTGPRNRMNPRYQYGVWLGMRNNSAECFIGNADGVFRAREIRRLEPQDRWDTRAIHSVIGVPWRMTDGRWTVDRPEVRVDPIPIPPLPLREHAFRGRESPSRTLTSSEPRLDAQGCNAIKDNKRAQAHSDRCRKRIEECLRNTPHGAERWDRREEEALAEEVRRGEQRKKRSDGTTAAVPETRSAAPEPMAGSAATESREDPIEPDPNPKRRILMKSASSTASGSGQQREKRPIPDGESRMQVEDMSEAGHPVKAQRSPQHQRTLGEELL